MLERPAQITGTIYKLTINAADTATAGPLVFALTGATDTLYVYAEVRDGIKVASVAANAVTAAAVADGAIDLATFAADALQKLIPVQYTGVLLQQSTAGVLEYEAHTAEAQVITASKNGGSFGAVNAGTTGVQIGATSRYKLTINAADTATLGPIMFLSTGATGTVLVHAYVVAYDPQAVQVTGIDLTAAIPRYKVQVDETDADKRTIQWYQLGTLPANLVTSLDGATAGTSAAAPATVSGGLRKLVLSAAEVAAVGTWAMTCTTTSTGACTVGMLVDIVDYDPVVGGPASAMSNAIRASRA